MGSPGPLYEIKELSEETWPDFESLFSRGNGWDHCWCMYFQRARQLNRKELRTRAEVGVINHRDKQQLVEQGRAHGILVYANREPVGWCQYGPKDELPVTVQSREDPGSGTDRVWRLTCFVIDRTYRRRGVARLALRAALDSIRAQGGGLVEAYPIACWSHGRDASPVAVNVPGAGVVAPAWGGFGNVSTSGTVSMFEKEGFEAIAVQHAPSARVRSYGAEGYKVLMRKTV